MSSSSSSSTNKGSLVKHYEDLKRKQENCPSTEYQNLHISGMLSFDLAKQAKEPEEEEDEFSKKDTQEKIKNLNMLTKEQLIQRSLFLERKLKIFCYQFPQDNDILFKHIWDSSYPNLKTEKQRCVLTPTEEKQSSPSVFKVENCPNNRCRFLKDYIKGKCLCNCEWKSLPF